MPNFIIIENAKHKHSKTTVKRKDTKNFNQTNFEADIQTKLHKISSINNARQAYSFFQKSFLNILNHHAPFRFLTKKQQELEQKLWITKGILISTHVKSKWFRLFKKTQQTRFYKLFKSYRDTLNSLIWKSNANK